ncbi:unnamed protein product [Brachionus calyciflorus]|uniref:STAS domain-containing protein n=1 Tax=Brachionus calyciflorus TaxID=104777 RepID=A0A814K8G3_9BILA|nr:unnamed protein product [Brachionus calyciflorus]
MNHLDSIEESKEESDKVFNFVSKPKVDPGYYSRSGYNEKQLASFYSFKPIKSENVFYGSKNYFMKYYKPSKSCFGKYILDRIPFLRWIVKYDYRQDLFKDFISGLTIGIIQIPQGMAYSLMAGLPPIIGLYVSFFTVIVYVLLGTSKHLSLGIYAIISLMTKACIDSMEGKLYPSHLEISSFNLSENSTNLNPNYLSHDPTEAKIMIGMSLAFFSGIVQILFAIFHVGFVTKYLSDVIVAAFTTGAAYHIVTSQINILLGIKLNHLDIPFKLIADYIEIFSHINHTNIATLIISLISMIFIYCVKHFVNEKYKDKMIIPIPVDLIVIITGTVLSYLLKFDKRWNVVIVGDIPLGIPAPKVPPLHIFPLIIGSSVSIAIVSFAINISMAKLFAKKYNYELEPNQELFAYGLGNVISGFFHGFPSCVGLSRSVILDAVGAKTQVYAIFASVLVLIVIVGIGPLFRSLPNACLAAIIVVALISLLIEVRQIKVIFKRSKFEALAWLITFSGVMILDVDYGLYIGLCFSLLLVIAQSQRASVSVLGNIPFTDMYENIDICEEAKEFEGIKILRYEASIYYANVDNFIYKINKLCGINKNDIFHKINKKKSEYGRMLRPSKFKKSKVSDIKISEDDVKKEMEKKISEILESIKIKDIILDFSCINFFDSMGVNAIVQLNEAFKELGVTIHLTYCKRCVFRVFKKNSFQDKFDYDRIYPTNHDAVLSILRNRKSNIHLLSNNKRNSSIHISLIDTENPLKTMDSPNPVYVIKRKPSNIFDDITLSNRSRTDSIPHMHTLDEASF